MGVAELGATMDELRQLGARMVRYVPLKVGLVQPVHRDQQNVLDPRPVGRRRRHGGRHDRDRPQDKTSKYETA